jgi:hypothetical protein
MYNANLMQQSNFIDIFLARHVSVTYAHHQEHLMLSWSIWFSARPSSGAFDVELQHTVFCTPIIRSI